MIDVVMPQMGESIVEGTLTKWLKKPGERVERDEPLFEISTDKVDTEIPSPVAGTLAEILVQEGKTVGIKRWSDGSAMARARRRRCRAAPLPPPLRPPQLRLRRLLQRSTGAPPPRRLLLRQPQAAPRGASYSGRGTAVRCRRWCARWRARTISI